MKKEVYKSLLKKEGRTAFTKNNTPPSKPTVGEKSVEGIIKCVTSAGNIVTSSSNNPIGVHNTLYKPA